MAELILALDVPSREQAVDIAKELCGTLKWCKIGLELFTRIGPQIISDLKDLDYKIFLDLKFYDIPNTVAKAIKSAAALDVDLLTIHCQGGLPMLKAAQASLEECTGHAPKLLGVTVLTSFSQEDLPVIQKPLAEVALELAMLASKANLYGLVCSPHEVANLKASYPNLHFLCPGIRPKSSECGDQKRVATPKEAVLAGADYLVVGRPILNAKDKRAACAAILAEMA